MREYDYVCLPRARRWTSFAASGLFFACSMSFTVIGYGSRIKGLFFFTAFVTLVISLLIAKRFIAKSYSYAVLRDIDMGIADIVICEHPIGKRPPFAVCRISLYEISELLEYDGTRKSRKKAKADKEKRKCGRFYNYCTEPFPREYCIMRFSEYGDDVYIKFMPDKRLKEMIKCAGF